MLVLVLITVGLLISAALLLWPHLDGSAPSGGDRDTAATEAEEQKARPTTLEGALVAQRLRGEISQAQYRNALSRLAVRDDERNPMSVPGNDRPDACA
jgi:hypothetical protein